MQRIYNFSPGPATLPTSVLQQAREEMLNWRGTGMSVMEVSHRGKEFMDVAARSTAIFRDLLDIPENYKVLFLQGGATLQFAAVPLNLAGPGDAADYVTTGNWGVKAIGEAGRYVRANEAAGRSGGPFTGIPDPASWRLSDDAEYLHLVVNETVVGVEFHEIPRVSDAPLAVDMSSTLLSRPVDIGRFGVIYAGAQKNIGPPGVTVVIVREDLLGRARPETPSVINYQVMANTDSMTNTPPTFSWYVAGLVFEWVRKQGGLSVMAEKNQRKASKLYAAIDGSDFYDNPVDPACRSWMNIPFVLADSALNDAFLRESAEAGLANLKGHRLVGGMRASIYNALPEAGVDALIAFMADFEARYG